MKFTYTKSAEELKQSMILFSILFAFDIPIHFAIWYVFGWMWSTLVLLFELSIIYISIDFVFTSLLLTDRYIYLHYGHWAKAKIPYSNVMKAEVYHGGVPETSFWLPVVTKPETFQGASNDVLFILLARRSLVKITLTKEIRVNYLREKSKVIVMSLDDPEGFVQTLRSQIQLEGTSSSQEVKNVDPAKESFPSMKANDDTAGKQRCENRFTGLAVEVEGLSKQFGLIKALDQISFSLGKGEILGLVGRNGAGKTTLMNLIVGNDLASSGQIRHHVSPVSYIPDTPFLYDDLTASEFLRFVGGLVKLPKNQIEVVVEQRLTESHLQDEKNKLIKHFSLGMKKRISIAAGLMRNPKLLVLDEITNGLDPIASQEVKIQLRQLAEDGCAILLSSHILDLISDLADRVAIMEKGRLLYVGEIPSEWNDADFQLSTNRVERFYLDLLRSGEGI